MKIDSCDGLLLYSVNTVLSWHVNKTFYDGLHFVWCSPVYNSDKLGEYDLKRFIPPSSNPHKIYIGLKEDVAKGDSHSAKISENRRGLLKGVQIKIESGVITAQEAMIIKELINNAPIKMFSPLLYLIPLNRVSTRLVEVPVSERANPFGVEYHIKDLHDSDFDIIEV